MIDNEFKKGNYVKLKIGGPAMIIDEIVNGGGTVGTIHAKCVWFDKLKHKTGLFSYHTIRKITIEDVVDAKESK